MKKLSLLFTLSALTTASVSAAIVHTSLAGETAALLAPSISDTDLLQTHLLSSSISGFDPIATYAPSTPNGGGLFDGIYNSWNNIDHAFGESYIDSSTGSEWSATFELDTSLNPGGFDITGINVFSGWNSGLASQDFTLELSYVGSTDYISIGRFTEAASNVALVISITEDTMGIIGAGVDGIRFTHHTGGGDARGSYREIDVIGIPEPATMAVLFGGVVALLVLRRRRG